MLVYTKKECADWVAKNYPNATNKDQIASDLEFYWDAYSSLQAAKSIVKEKYGKL